MLLPADPTTAAAVSAVAAFLMVATAVGRNRLGWRTVECPVCHHPRTSCTCRWR